MAAVILFFTIPALAAGEITFGGAISKTGRYAEPAGRFVNAYRLFVDHQNAKGGLLGRKLNLILLDDKSDKQTAIKLYERLITQEKVDFTLGPYSSGITDAIANILETHKYPTLAPEPPPECCGRRAENTFSTRTPSPRRITRARFT